MKFGLALIAFMLMQYDAKAHEDNSTDLHSSSDIQEYRDNKQLESKQKLERFFENYMQHYNAYLKDPKDTDALNDAAANYQQPAMQIIPGIPLRSITEPEQLVKGTQGFLNQLKTAGVTHIKWEKVQIKLMGPNTAIASNIGIRYKDNGEIFNKAAATYIMTQTEQGWKIAALALHDPKHTLSL